MTKNTEREIVQHIDQSFVSLIGKLKDLAGSVSPDLLYKSSASGSIGENILRSAAVIEQTCGGLTANLWDDPFEWTLPETLSTTQSIIAYLSEVDVARQRAFDAIADDSALAKYISDPSGKPRPLICLLLETLVKASDFRGRALRELELSLL